MARVKASQTTAEQVGSAPVPQPSRWLLQQQPGHLASLQHPCQELLVMPQHSVPNSTHAMQRQQQQQQLSLEVVEDQDVPDVGRFTAYADGRVRVLFADRTILTLDAGRERAQLILPDGSKREVSASKPVGVEEYVQVGGDKEIFKLAACQIGKLRPFTPGLCPANCFPTLTLPGLCFA